MFTKSESRKASSLKEEADHDTSSCSSKSSHSRKSSLKENIEKIIRRLSRSSIHSSSTQNMNEDDDDIAETNTNTTSAKTSMPRFMRPTLSATRKIERELLVNTANVKLGEHGDNDDDDDGRVDDEPAMEKCSPKKPFPFHLNGIVEAKQKWKERMNRMKKRSAQESHTKKRACVGDENMTLNSYGWATGV